MASKMPRNNKCPECDSIEIVIGPNRNNLLCRSCGVVVQPSYAMSSISSDDPISVRQNGGYKSSSQGEEANLLSAGESKGQETRNVVQMQKKLYENDKCSECDSTDFEADPWRENTVYCRSCGVVLPYDSTVTTSLSDYQDFNKLWKSVCMEQENVFRLQEEFPALKIADDSVTTSPNMESK